VWSLSPPMQAALGRLLESGNVALNLGWRLQVGDVGVLTNTGKLSLSLSLTHTPTRIQSLTFLRKLAPCAAERSTDYAARGAHLRRPPPRAPLRPSQAGCVGGEGVGEGMICEGPLQLTTTT
jgi:hypothetical protein